VLKCIPTVLVVVNFVKLVLVAIIEEAYGGRRCATELYAKDRCLCWKMRDSDTYQELESELDDETLAHYISESELKGKGGASGRT
jgi:hypothetical protein